MTSQNIKLITRAVCPDLAHGLTLSKVRGGGRGVLVVDRAHFTHLAEQHARRNRL